MPSPPNDGGLPRDSVLDTNPHLGHYVYKLVLTTKQTRSTLAPAPGPHQHPLSVSSSGESDDDEPSDPHALDGASSADEDGHPAAPPSSASAVSAASTSGASVSTANSHANGRAHTGPSREEREQLVLKIIDLLDNEQEEDIKDLLRGHMGEFGKDELLMDQVALDCMHRHRDDLSGVPYQAGTFTPTRLRRPYTPSGVGTLRARTPLARPHSPAVGHSSGTSTPTGSGPGMSALGRVDSASSSTLAPGGPASSTGSAPPGPPSSSGYSSSGSPASSPRVLNVKAAAFNPPGLQQPQPSARPPPITMPSFSPADAWRDAPPAAPTPPRSPAPFASQGMSRTGSNRAIAAPIMSDPSSPFHSPLGTPTRSHTRIGPEAYASPLGSTSAAASLATNRPSSRGVVPDEEDDEEFSPFGTGLPRMHHHEPSRLGTGLNTFAKPFEPFGSSDAAAQPEADEDDPSLATAGMTPLDVLGQVFSTVPKHQLESALHNAGYDFEAAMAMLVSQFAHPRSGASTPNRVASPRPMIGVDGRSITHLAPGQGYFQQGGRGFNGPPNAGAFGGGGPRNVGPTRMCRYFLNGECRRSDCRFSHDLERALCRFWLRGHCAKGPNCEFMHNLPNNMDPSALSQAMARMDVSSPMGSHPSTPPVNNSYGPQDDFPDLLAARLNRHVGRFDPSRNRFANAVKRPMPAPPPGRFSPAPGFPAPGATPGAAPGAAPAPGPGVPAIPRPSQRLKLHPPILLPTLKTGSAANEQYLAARATSIRLGHARNACLARAADAFRRGDGAAAKRFSREGKALNEKMLNESHEAANALVKERMKDAQKAVKERDMNWSDDPHDRTERGKECGAGLGVILGVASAGAVPDGKKLGSEERTECLVDLHTLHGPEGADIASVFLAELERERYRGLAYLVVGEEKHVGAQDPGRGASKVRLANSVKQFLAEWGYAWSESGGVLCVDPCR